MPEQRKKLVLIDGNSLLYRAFFGMRHLSTSDGLPTNAIYGLTTMILSVLEQKPDYIAVAFDTPKPTFRHEEYKEYKAHREAPPDELIKQVSIARELIRAFNIPVVEVDGFEADDIIGAIAEKAKDRGIDTVIVTGDLDALQLVNDHVTVMATVKGVSDTVTYDDKAVAERYGIRPEQMADFKGLKGDPSDNIPGVPGIGDKTAASLLKEYGSIENLLENLDKLPEGRVKKSLQENADLARLSKRLATIVTHLPAEINIEEFRASEPDYDALRDLFVRLEFKTMLKRLPQVSQARGGAAASEKKPTLSECRNIGSAQELSDFLVVLEQAGEFAFHCHTRNGKSIEAEIIGLAFSAGPGRTAYVEVVEQAAGESLELGFDGPYKAPLSDFAPLLCSDKIAKYCHDSKLSYAPLSRKGLKLSGVAFDTMLGAYLLDPSRGSFEIGAVAFEQLSLELPGVTEAKQDRQLQPAECFGAEVEAIYLVKPVIEDKLKQADIYDLLQRVEMPLAPILAQMELEGVAVDVSQLEALSVTLEVDIKKLESEIYELAGEEFNIGSPKQLQYILFEKLGLEASRKTKTGYSTNAAALEMLSGENPIVDKILQYRELTKIKSTYADALPKLINPRTGRIHTSLNQAVTATGRLSSSDPNLQNIPVRTELGRQIRKAFIASDDNLLLSADYSQIELRILAHVTQDPELLRAFRSDEDIHNATACTLFNCSPEDVTPEMRRRAKTVNFAVIYGMSDFSLARALGLSTHEARSFIDTYFARFPGVRAYTEETIARARELGYVTTLMGRRRYIQDINSSNRSRRLFAERAAVNMPIQGTAADIMKVAMIGVSNSLASADLKSKMLLQVHDEILLEVPRGEIDHVAGLVRSEMQKAYELDVPLKADVKVGRNWSEMEEVVPTG